MNTTFDRLRAILARDYKLEASAVTPDSPLDQLGLDSLATVELLWNVEDEFKIKLPSEPVSLVTVDDVVRYIDSLIEARIAAAATAGAPLASA